MKKTPHLLLPFRQVQSLAFGLLLPTVLLLSFSCSSPCGNSKEAFIGKLDQLIEQVKQLNYPPDDQRWEKYDEKIETLFDFCYEEWKAELSVKEKAHLISQMATYAYQRTKNNQLKKQLKEVLQESKEGLKALQKELNPPINELKRELNEILQELE